jgi:hypothetical protein
MWVILGSYLLLLMSYGVAGEMLRNCIRRVDPQSSRVSQLHLILNNFIPYSLNQIA